MHVANIEQLGAGKYEIHKLGRSPVTITDLRVGEPDLAKRVVDYEGIAARCDTTQLQFLVDYGDMFEHLIGEQEAPRHITTGSGRLDPDKLQNLGCRVLELENFDAYSMADRLTMLANQIITKGLDPKLCAEYARIAEHGFSLMRDLAPIKGIDSDGNVDTDTRIVPLVRGSLPVSRMMLGVDKNARIPEEHWVDAKRVRLHGGAATDLAGLIRWREKNNAEHLIGKHIVLPDFVNPASYASSLAMLITLRILARKTHVGYQVLSDISHRSFAVTLQGMLNARKLIQQVAGVQNPEFVAIALGFELDSKYYLTGKRVVADAGDVLEEAGLMPEHYTR